MGLIKVEELYKVYKVKDSRKGLLGGVADLFAPQWIDKEAVNCINFTINQGESVGYIGPNGSGKSTTIKMLTGILYPTSGRVLVNNVEPYHNRLKNASMIGAVFGQRSQLWWDLAIRESFELFRHIYRIPYPIFKKNLDKMIELLGLNEFYSTPVRQLSLGQRMRAEIACAFFHEPLIVYLDEPTIGLDVVAKEQVRIFLREINKEKQTTIILTTHDMDDIQQVCERLILIDRGQLIFDSPMEHFVNQYGKERMLLLQLEHHVDNLHVDQGVLVENQNNQAKILFNKDSISATKLIQKMTESYPIIDCKIEEPKIEHLMRMVYEERGRH
ncbi:ATP-binding cassette domain-containing protein [Paenibacillus sp. ACRRX]|uniref:ABC transporter ATP-binding protein n=1 Tax=unclassified Paenibacillus TaxID=185978 RepID=UPI001EF6AE73|nr:MULTISPECIES: ATP-binding cassette domain-containing protein [unclassified Paenibacillus]MCG7408505.1 ATP-binding cassette domain-containing protein [Paenibacillus sp. ACRRX]MDK8182752.1 ATP-binding cassette domain-containing protein [Paenibacillus sp. UMB4589-SE434]